jgi:hypothetical protein
MNGKGFVGNLLFGFAVGMGFTVGAAIVGALLSFLASNVGR